MKKDKRLWIVLGVVIVLVIGACAGMAVLVSLATTSGGMRLGDAVAIVRVEGVIVSGSPPVSPFGDGGAYSDQIVEHLEQAQKDSSVKAIVLRINSPGGSVVASDEIYQQMLKMEKPIVVSMGELAASGGYYISAPADLVMANPATLTGSIGVIAQVTNLEELMEKIGVEVVVIKSGIHKDEGSPFREMTEEEKAIWQAIIDEAYGQFVTIVAEGRDLPEEKVREIADGRVYTGKQAMEQGLVDELGNLPQAIDRAAELGGIEGEPRLVEYHRPPTLFETFLGSLVSPFQPFDLARLLDLEGRPSLQYLYLEP
ncbi:MAG: signal peptide peptidase SppA [Anaerolineales bacterium]|nr:MAG: signal peptide peptidase SppA [Anaerolineales bacterium]